MAPAIGSDGSIYLSNGYEVFSVEPEAGNVKWAFGPNDYQTGYCCASGSPAIGSDGTIYFGGGFGLWAFANDSTWSYKLNLPLILQKN